MTAPESYDDDFERVSRDINYRILLNLVKKIRGVFLRYEGKNVSRETAAQLCNDLAYCIADKMDRVDTQGLCDSTGETRETIFMNLLRVIHHNTSGQLIDREYMKYWSLRLAGNVRQLRLPNVSPAMETMDTEWSLANIVEASAYTTPVKRIYGGLLTFQVLTGSMAANEIHQFFSNDAIRYAAVKLGVVDRRDDTVPHPRQLVGMKLYIRIEHDNKVGHRVVKYQPWPELNNRNKHRVMSRKKRKNCVYTTKQPCHFCPVGLRCVNSTHRREYVESMCIRGHKGTIDPKDYRGLCMSCQAKSWLAKFH